MKDKNTEPNQIGVYILGVKNQFRGKELLKSLDRIQIEPTIVWGPDLDSDMVQISEATNQKFAKFTIRRKIKLEEVACCIGHLRMYEVFLENDLEWGLFLEDDVILNDAVVAIFSILPKSVRPLHLMIHDGPGTNLRVRKRAELEFETKGKFTRVLDPNYGAYGYLLNKQAAQLVINNGQRALINTPDWPYVWPKEISVYKSTDVYASHPENLDSSLLGLRINKKDNMWFQLPNPIRMMRAISLGVTFSQAFHKEIRLKTIRIALQAQRKLNKRRLSD